MNHYRYTLPWSCLTSSGHVDNPTTVYSRTVHRWVHISRHRSPANEFFSKRGMTSAVELQEVIASATVMGRVLVFLALPNPGMTVVIRASDPLNKSMKRDLTASEDILQGLARPRTSLASGPIMTSLVCCCIWRRGIGVEDNFPGRFHKHGLSVGEVSMSSTKAHCENINAITCLQVPFTLRGNNKMS